MRHLSAFVGVITRDLKPPTDASVLSQAAHLSILVLAVCNRIIIFPPWLVFPNLPEPTPKPVRPGLVSNQLPNTLVETQVPAGHRP